MNRSIEIENFKCFAEHTKIHLGKITACAGMNSVGKSSVIQSFLLTRQIYDAACLYRDTRINEYKIELNGAYGLQLGDSQHIKSSLDKEDILLKVDEYEFNMKSMAKHPLQLTIKCPYSLQNLEKAQGIFAKNFYYLNAERLGPRNYQEIHALGDSGCGIHGENTFHFISLHEPDRIDSDRCFQLGETKKVTTANKQIEYWMDYIIPGVELNINQWNELGISSLGIRQQVFDTGFMSPYNFGFGISYILPIIATGLLAPKGSMVIVENPEAHLHPCGQSRMGFFLAVVAMSGVQVILETHSEHIINGMRIAAARLGMLPEDICINFFSIDFRNSLHKVLRLELNEKMDIMEWPEGFLDQEEKDLRTLREIRRNKWR